MKKFVVFVLLVILNGQLMSQAVGIGTTTPHSSAALEVQSTTQGMLVPRMSSAQRALIAPVQGLLIFDTDTNTFWFFNNTVWVNLTAAAFTLPYFDEASAAVPALTIRNNGAAAGIRGMGVTGPGLYGFGSGGGLFGSAIRAENNHSAGIGLYSITNSTDANTVIANPGTGDLLRGFSGPSAGTLVYRILNNGSLLTSGNVGIGTTAVPAVKLEVNGSMRINNGTQAAGRVLTSDAAGVASWQQPTTAPATTYFEAKKSPAVETHQFFDGSFNRATVTYPFESVDMGGNYDASTHSYIIPATGVYHFQASVTYDGASGLAALYFTLNGSIVAFKEQGVTSSSFTMDITWDGSLNAGTAVSIQARIPNSCAWRNTASFSGWKVF